MQKTIKTNQLINYICIATIILHPIFLINTGIDGLARLPFIATSILCLNCVTKYYKKIFSAPYIFWWIWVIYSIINTMMTGGITFVDPLIFYVNKVLCGAVIMTVSAVEFNRNAKDFFKFMAIILLVYTLLGLKEFNFSLGADNMDMWEHNISDLGNMLPITSVFLGCIAVLQYKYKFIKKTHLFAILTLILAVIITAATRKAFGAIVIVILFSMIGNFLQSPTKFIKFSIVFIIGYYAILLLLDNSFLGNRFAMASESSELSEFADNRFLSAMGDRAIMYVEGWNIFLNKPLTGIGLAHYHDIGSIDVWLHTEYMVQLAECGIIGSLLFLLFYITIIMRLIKVFKIKENRDITLTCLGIILAILFMSFTAWTYEFPIYFITIGIVTGYTERMLNKLK